jgi:hypothetical protein
MPQTAASPSAADKKAGGAPCAVVFLDDAPTVLPFLFRTTPGSCFAVDYVEQTLAAPVHVDAGRSRLRMLDALRKLFLS